MSRLKLKGALACERLIVWTVGRREFEDEDTRKIFTAWSWFIVSNRLSIDNSLARDGYWCRETRKKGSFAEISLSWRLDVTLIYIVGVCQNKISYYEWCTSRATMCEVAIGTFLWDRKFVGCLCRWNFLSLSKFRVSCLERHPLCWKSYQYEALFRRSSI